MPAENTPPEETVGGMVPSADMRGRRTALEELEAIMVNPSSRAERKDHLMVWIYRWVIYAQVTSLTPVSMAEASPAGARDLRFQRDQGAIHAGAADLLLSSSAVLHTDRGIQEAVSEDQPEPAYRSELEVLLLRACPRELVDEEEISRGVLLHLPGGGKVRG